MIASPSRPDSRCKSGGFVFGLSAADRRGSKTMECSLEGLLSNLDSSDERLRVVLVGTNAQIAQAIRQLHSLGFADVKD